MSDSVARGPDGAYYVGEFWEPFELGAANVWRVVPGQEPQIYCAGFNFIADLDFDRRGNLYVLEYVSVPFTGAVPGGARHAHRVGRAAAAGRR